MAPVSPAAGLLLALAAAAGNNLGKGLRKAATRHLPALTLARKEVREGTSSSSTSTTSTTACRANAHMALKSPRDSANTATVQSLVLCVLLVAAAAAARHTLVPSKQPLQQPPVCPASPQWVWVMKVPLLPTASRHCWPLGPWCPAA